MAEDQSTLTTPPPPKFEYDLDSLYANNTRLETSVWDIKVLFGELGQHTGQEIVTFHTAITMPWLQAKLLCYYLQLNVAVHELSGKIAVPSQMMPSLPQPPTPEDGQADFPLRKQIHEIASAMRAEMFG